MAVDLEYFGVPPADYIQLANRTRLTAASGQTTFSAPYTVGYVDVFYNGAKLDPFTEFTATDGANVVLTSAASATGDIVEVVSQAQVALANTYTQAQVNALANSYYGICTGTGDAQVLVTTPTFNTFGDGMVIRCRAVAQNATTTPTITINGLSTKTVVANNSNGALYSKDWTTNNELTFRYNQSIDRLVLVDGGSTQQTPAQFDNSNQIATTASVNTRGVAYVSQSIISTATTLTATSAGKEITITAAVAVTLPVASTIPAGTVIHFLSNVGGASVLRQGTDVIAVGNGGSTTVVALGAGDTLVLMSDGISSFVAIGGSTQLGSAAAFGASVAVTGYQKFPTGLIMQWGTSTFSTGGSAVTYPIAFPSSLHAITLGNPDSSAVVPSTTASTLTGFTGVISTGSSASMWWAAFGH